MAYTTINKSTTYFNTVLYTGNATDDRTVTGVGFQPDWLWIKNRADTEQHRLQDVVRGATKNIKSSGAGGEETTSTNVKSFDSDGFTLGTDNAVNGNSDNMVSWSWKAGGTGSSNSNGSVTSTVSANTTTGFSICKFNYPNSGNFTVGHGLGVAPDVVIVKGLGAGYNTNWQVYHSALGNTYNTQLNYTNASTTAANWWGSTSPTSTVFTVGADLVETGNMAGIAYCFAAKTGYSKFGKYIGNGNADGTFVYTGFKPALIIIKSTGYSENWFIFDNKRPGYNLNANHLNPNSSTSETASSANTMDILSNGFKMKATNNGINRSGDTFIYAAFGQSLVGSNNVPCTAR